LAQFVLRHLQVRADSRFRITPEERKAWKCLMAAS